MAGVTLLRYFWLFKIKFSVGNLALFLPDSPASICQNRAARLRWVLRKEDPFCYDLSDSGHSRESLESLFVVQLQIECGIRASEPCLQ